MERCRSEFNEVSSLLLNVKSESDHHSTIRDCHRIGRYNPNADRSRPMLVSLSSTADVRNILSLRRSLPSHVLVRSDKSPNERRIWSILSEERRKLIASGLDGNAIRIVKSELHVDGQLKGKVINIWCLK
jgi:hypothetical protein